MCALTCHNKHPFPPSLPPSVSGSHPFTFPTKQTVVNRVMEVQQLAPDQLSCGASEVDLGAAGRLQLNRHLSLAGALRWCGVVWVLVWVWPSWQTDRHGVTDTFVLPSSRFLHFFFKQQSPLVATSPSPASHPITVTCPSHPHTHTHTELRRHKRAFLKLATKITFTRLQDPAAAQRLFVDHLRVQLTQQQLGGSS